MSITSEERSEIAFSLEHAPFSAYHTEVIRRLFGDSAADAPHEAASLAREQGRRAERERAGQIVGDIECNCIEDGDCSRCVALSRLESK